MNSLRWLHPYFASIAAQDAEAIRNFFHPDAQILWHNTNERFTLDGFLRANCEYPGSWAGEVERAESIGEGRVLSVARVWIRGCGPSFHVVSFFELAEGKIVRLDEYWGDDGPAPAWRQELRLSAPIR